VPAVSGFLARACAEARERVAAARGHEPDHALAQRASAVPPPPEFAAALAAPGVAVIAEVKRASPSRGHLADIPDAAALAEAYATAGAAAVSVLTEPRHFAGSLDDLRAVAASAEVPVLRKDFIVDGYQVLEAKAAGAAAVLLIVAGLDDRDLAALLRATEAAGLDALVEVHDVAEVDRAVAAASAADWGRRLVVGVNARDLTTLEVDPGRFAAVRDALPDGALAVAESGVRDPDDVRRLASEGADAILVGESVATASDPHAAVARLVAAGARDAAGLGLSPSGPPDAALDTDDAGRRS